MASSLEQAYCLAFGNLVTEVDVMSRSFANSLGIAAVAILAILVVNDVQSLFHSSTRFPWVITVLMICMIVVLGTAFFTYQIVRGKPLEPSFSEDKLREMMADSVRQV